MIGPEFVRSLASGIDFAKCRNGAMECEHEVASKQTQWGRFLSISFLGRWFHRHLLRSRQEVSHCTFAVKTLQYNHPIKREQSLQEGIPERKKTQFRRWALLIT